MDARIGEGEGLAEACGGRTHFEPFSIWSTQARPIALSASAEITPPCSKLRALQWGASSTRALLAAALCGAGIALLPVPFAARTGSLVEVPLSAALPTRQPWLIVHRDLRGLPAIRLLQKWIVATFADL